MKMIFRLYVLIAGAMFVLAGESQASSSCQTPANIQTMVNAFDSEFAGVRRQLGARQMRYNAALSQAAQTHACDMAVSNFFGHDGSNGSNVQQRARANGYRDCLIAENIAWGTLYDTPEKLLSGWMDSQGHRHNMALNRVRDYGVGVAIGPRGPYWVLVLAKGC